jgi:hypothetical protein
MSRNYENGAVGFIHLEVRAVWYRLRADKYFSDSPTGRVGESFFDYEYLREFEAKIGTARKVV